MDQEGKAVTTDFSSNWYDPISQGMYASGVSKFKIAFEMFLRNAF